MPLREIENRPGVVYDETKKYRIFAEDLQGLDARITEIEENPPAGGGAWGEIEGTLSDQTDLQSALDAKQDALGYTAENVANKATTMSGNTGSNTLYLTAKAIYDWAVATFETALGYTAENVANKDTSTSLGTSDTKYPSQKAVKTYVDNNIPATFTNKILISATQQVFTSNSEGDLYSGTIPANVLSTNNAIHFIIYVSNYTANTSRALTLKLYLGTTVIATLTTSNGNSTDPGSLQGIIEGWIIANGSTSAQKGVIRLDLMDGGQEGWNNTNANLNKLSNTGTGTATEDSTSSKTVKITAQWNGSTTQTITCEGIIIDVIK